jgi:hypothetical protein
MDPLLSRDDFRKAVFERDVYQCVMCGEPAQDAHHILERRLFPDGGYRISNGASVCGKHHLEAEQTTLSCNALRECCGIAKPILPPDFYEEFSYDKWGNIIHPNGTRSPGPLFHDESVQKVIAPVLHLFVPYTKYPRTHHLSWSPGVTSDDRIIPSMRVLETSEVVVTEKLDGEQTSMYRDHIHARAIDSGSHPSRTWSKRIHAEIAHEIPQGWRVVAENLQGVHSIRYARLPSYLMVFAVFDEKGVCLSWPDVEEWAALLGLPTVPVLYRGPWDEAAIKGCFTGISKYGPEQEGYVVRVASAFTPAHFRDSIAKYVRANHVQTATQNWMMKPVVLNGLADR